MERQIRNLTLDIFNLKMEVEKLQFEAQLIALAEEEHTQDTQDEVLKCEEAYISDPTDEAAGKALDKAYDKHEEAIDARHEAEDRLDYITKALEMLDRAERYLAWAE